ncbi:signal recognition particle receptor subunit beta [Murinocardiopsis flavida]|uniref:Signal recognition particle receptor subunit beta n=1 Tax=Murinocardiopsis flavida TaxID=645275 RepID=A0A2P8DJ01_9ACTN|nr:ATP/GTP-binding protein [Murinocardiopsis flavida]PSK97171.1 signal recognition particle receptor subunit beta [Murinocardiopsis flavida]
MASSGSDVPGREPSGAVPTGPVPTGPVPTAVKIVVAGGFGTGKSTLIRAVSEMDALDTDEVMTDVSLGVDDLSGVEGKTTTTVALDFGRITIGGDLVLYLFGAPGQERFRFMWDELARGALGVVILADTRRLNGCFPAIDYCERGRLPFVVAVNAFEGAARYDPAEVREAIGVGAATPVVVCDARRRASAKDVLTALVETALLPSDA